MHKSFDITMDSITKIEGTAQLEVKVVEGNVESLKFIIADYRRFYTEAVKGKHYAAVPLLLSRICGTCSMAHLFASIESIEKALGIHDQISEQTKVLRKLSINGMMIRDHALHLYIFSLPDVLGIDSVLDIPDDDSHEHLLLHDAFDLKALGNKLSTVFAGAAIHSPYPRIGGFNVVPEGQDFSELVSELEAAREKALRGIDAFFDWKAELIRPTDFMCIKNDDFNFVDGQIQTYSGTLFPEESFRELLDEIVIPYSQSKGYLIKNGDNHDDFLVGALARLNINKDNLHPNTKRDASKHLEYFPSMNVYDNCLAQAIEILHCIDLSIDLLRDLKLEKEEPMKITPKAGTGVGVMEAPRGILYHKAVTDEKGVIVDADVIVPTSQNQIHIEKSLKKMFQDNLEKMSEEELKQTSEEIIRAYDPCMSCATNFLEIVWT